MGTVRVTVERIEPEYGRSWDQVNRDRRMQRGWSPAQIVAMFTRTRRRPARPLRPRWNRSLSRTDQNGPPPKGWHVREDT